MSDQSTSDGGAEELVAFSALPNPRRIVTVQGETGEVILSMDGQIDLQVSRSLWE